MARNGTICKEITDESRSRGELSEGGSQSGKFCTESLVFLFTRTRMDMRAIGQWCNHTIGYRDQ